MHPMQFTLPMEKTELTDAMEATELTEATEKAVLQLRTEQKEEHAMIDIIAVIPQIEYTE